MSWRVRALSDIEAVPGPAGLAYKAVRMELGLRAFGLASFVAEHAGDDVIEPHAESQDGRDHEELYLVMRGRARFVLDGEAVDAPAGTMVRVAPEVRRHAIALEARTEVLAFGAPPTYVPAGQEWLWVAKARLARGDIDGAQALLDEALHELPYSAAARYGLALVHRARGDEAEASRWMDAALKIEPGLANQE